MNVYTSCYSRLPCFLPISADFIFKELMTVYPEALSWFFQARRFDGCAVLFYAIQGAMPDYYVPSLRFDHTEVGYFFGCRPVYLRFCSSSDLSRFPEEGGWIMCLRPCCFIKLRRSISQFRVGWMIFFVQPLDR